MAEQPKPGGTEADSETHFGTRKRPPLICKCGAQSKPGAVAPRGKAWSCGKC